MVVEVEDGRIRRIEPLEANRATPEGVCLKGLSYIERVESPERILFPLRRRVDRSGARRPDSNSGRADGLPPAVVEAGFERISWDEAFAVIGSKLENLRATGDPRSVLYYSGSGTKGLLNKVGRRFWHLFGGCTTTYGDLCWPAGLEATRLTLGDNKHSAPWDLAHARLIVMWGKNAAETNIHQMRFVQQALDAGARLIVIDPRRTQTAEGAEMLVQPRPGTDGALALAIAHQLVQHDWIDHGFVATHVQGFVPFAERLKAFTPEWAADVTEVPVEQIRELAAAIGTIAPLTICAGYGMQRYTNSGQSMRALLALLAMTGNIGKPGAGWVYANLQSHVFEPIKETQSYYPPAVADDVVRVSVSTTRLGRDMLACTDPPLRMGWVERGNPVTQNPDTTAVLEAFRQLELLVVVDQFLTDTAREADIILPAKSMFEQSDVIGAYWHPYIHLKAKVIEPPGEVKPETEVYWELAQRLGLEANLADGECLEQLIPAPSDAAVEAYLERQLESCDGLTLARLRNGPVLVPGHQEVAFADYRFDTPSGKVEILSPQAAERWNADPLPSWFEPRESLRSGCSEATRFPLHLITPNTKNRIHSQFNNLRMIRQFSDKPRVQIHPADALTRGLSDRDVVRLFNDRGSLRIEIRLDAGIKPGCVAVTNGWWIAEGGAVNFLSKGRETDMGHGAAFHDVLVQIEAAPSDNATLSGDA